MENLNTRSNDNNPSQIGIFKSVFCFFFVFYQTCSFGKYCKFLHPKDDEIDRDAMIQNAKKSPCKFFLSGLGFCKYGDSCRYGHSEPIYVPNLGIHINADGYPKRWDEPDCTYYLRTGYCGYGVACKFHHPDPIFYDPYYGSYDDSQAVFYKANQGYLGINDGWNANLFYAKEPCVTLNNVGLPLRPGRKVCRHYVKFNQCKYGWWCKFHHP